VRGSRDLGQWDLVVRQVGGWDACRIRQVAAWPLRELLLAYIDILKCQALERYEHDLAVWAQLAPHQKDPPSPPKPPRILKS
jgi:hypothetical protein